ncbi:RNA polymerase sigma factor [Tellurirhabdus rosea]|uniref:RNA polymerase sigma factor n=1 Tax=Tellurirhabdus rosea TaxID=2674997 RepID=UPI0022518BC8|nr:sigma-70 family RNA polymerase sigma factor [Tellurirhabdus rosea]
MSRVQSPPEPTERDLVERCRIHDRTAQRLLFERYKRAMFTKAFRILNDADHAHDVLQDAFVEVFRSLHSFRYQSTLGAWIKTIVIRQALRKLARESRFETLTDQHDQPMTVPDTLTGQQLDAAIRALPDGARAVFLLIEVEGYAHREVADLLAISEGTSKSQLSYAKKLLRKQLADLHPDR